MALPTGELQVAMIAKYRGDTTLQGLLAGATAPAWNIYDADGVPTNLDLNSNDYIVVYHITGSLGTVFTMGVDARDIETQVSIFTRQGGFTLIRQIAKQVDKLTHGPLAGPFTLSSGFVDVGTLQTLYQEVPASDTYTQEGILRYRSWIQG